MTEPAAAEPPRAEPPPAEPPPAEPRARTDPIGRVRLRTLVTIRWIAVAGQLAALLLVRYGLGFELPIGWALVPVAASAALNLAIALRQPLRARLAERPAALYLAYDILQLSVLLTLTGGLKNPFSVLILGPVIVSATVLSRRSTLALGFLSAAAITALALWHLPIPWGGETAIALPSMYVIGIWGALVLGIVFIAAWVGSVSGEARQLSNAIAATQMALAREQRLSALGGLAAAAAHELGSPLATIAVVAKEMKREVEKDTPLAEDVDLLLEQSDRCRDILASLSRRPDVDPGDPFARLPVTALAEAAGEPYAGGPIEVRFAGEGEGEVPMVARSPEALHALGTLIENAVQFARRRVDVVTGWDDQSVSITVRDDGPGFAANVRDKLGEPYVSSRNDDGHMGLGIFIASTLLRRIGAEVSFSNAPDGGAMVATRWNRTTIEAEQRGMTT